MTVALTLQKLSDGLGRVTSGQLLFEEHLVLHQFADSSLFGSGDRLLLGFLGHVFFEFRDGEVTLFNDSLVLGGLGHVLLRQVGGLHGSSVHSQSVSDLSKCFVLGCVI